MDPIDELKEHAEKAHDPFDRRVGASMAIIAAVLALVAVSGHVSTTEELLSQQKASDQWAFYQAKSLRRYQSEVAHDLLATMGNPAAAKLEEKYSGSIERYEKEGEEIQNRAQELERESELSGHKALRLHLGEIFLEMALVLASLAILTKRAPIWLAALATSSLGALIAASIFLIRG